MSRSRVSAGVAAGHPATVDAGIRVLAEGGNAVDAAVAAVLTSCAAETILCGLGGGGFATVFSADTGAVTVLDFFCAMPGLSGDTAGPMVPVEIDFGGVPIPYQIGGASVAVPGVPAGCAELHHRFGRLPWHEVVQPAYDTAHHGTTTPEPQVVALRSIQSALTLDQGKVYLNLIEGGGDHLHHPGLDDAFALLAQGFDVYMAETTPLMIESVHSAGGALSYDDVQAYRVISRTVASASLAGRTICGRADLNNTLLTIGSLPALERLDRAERAVASARAQRTVSRHSLGEKSRGETTNISVVDGDGNACVVTHTLGLGAGVWLPGLGVHLNSMLGEGELLAGDISAGDRIQSMMCPLVVLAPDGRLELAIGSAGASRIRSALMSTLIADLVEANSVRDAVMTPRMHVADDLTHVEPGYPEDAEAALVADGFAVQRWTQTNHYFGGVSAVGRGGASGDPRRGGWAGVI